MGEAGNWLARGAFFLVDSISVVCSSAYVRAEVEEEAPNVGANSLGCSTPKGGHEP